MLIDHDKLALIFPKYSVRSILFWVLDCAVLAIKRQNTNPKWLCLKVRRRAIDNTICSGMSLSVVSLNPLNAALTNTNYSIIDCDYNHISVDVPIRTVNTAADIHTL